MIIYTTQTGDVLDLLCYLHKNKWEDVLEANPHLTPFAAYLPAGITIHFDETVSEQTLINTVSLWD